MVDPSGAPVPTGQDCVSYAPGVQHNVRMFPTSEDGNSRRRGSCNCIIGEKSKGETEGLLMSPGVLARNLEE